MFTEPKTTNTPTEICAAVEKTTRKRAASNGKKPKGHSQRAPIANEAACAVAQPTERAPLVSTPNANPDAGKPFRTDPAHIPAILAIRDAHRTRQAYIVGSTRLTNMAKAMIRSSLAIEKFGDRDSPEAKAAEKAVDAAYKAALSDEDSVMHAKIAGFESAKRTLSEAAAHYEKVMVRELKKLPIMDFCRETKGLGETSLATLIAEATVINREDNRYGRAGEVFAVGDFRSVSALWKRLGTAVIGGKRQGQPGQGATADDWVEHGYKPKRRSVGYVAREHLIGSMGLWRPAPGEDVDANPDLTEYQRLYAHRARLEAVKLDMPVETRVNAKGVAKESYKGHVCNRAHRYVEKRMTRDLYAYWRRCM